MARLGPRFWPQNSPRKSLCGSLFCVLSQKMRHINFFLGTQIGGFWVGAKKVMLKKFMCFFCPLLISRTSGRKKFHEKVCTFSTRDKTKLFHREILGPREWGAPTTVGRPWRSCSRSSRDAKRARLSSSRGWSTRATASIEHAKCEVWPTNALTCARECAPRLFIRFLGKNSLQRLKTNLTTQNSPQMRHFTLSGFKKALLQNPWEMIQEWFGFRPESQSYRPKVGVTDQKSELQWRRPPESEPNRPEKEPETGLGASAENPP